MPTSPQASGGREAAAVALYAAISRDLRVVDRTLTRIERKLEAAGADPDDARAARFALQAFARRAR